MMKRRKKHAKLLADRPSIMCTSDTQIIYKLHTLSSSCALPYDVGILVFPQISVNNVLDQFY